MTFFCIRRWDKIWSKTNVRDHSDIKGSPKKPLQLKLSWTSTPVTFYLRQFTANTTASYNLVTMSFNILVPVFALPLNHSLDNLIYKHGRTMHKTCCNNTMLTMCPIKFFQIIIFNAKITVSLIIFNLPAVTQTGLHWKKFIQVWKIHTNW